MPQTKGHVISYVRKAMTESSKLSKFPFHLYGPTEGVDVWEAGGHVPSQLIEDAALDTPALG